MFWSCEHSFFTAMIPHCRRKWALHDAKMKYVGSMTEKEAKKYIKSEFKG